MNNTRILYLEDDLDLGETTADFLTREGFLVEWKQNGTEGLQALEDGIFDIVVADIMMPQLDGYTFLKTIRESGNQIPLIYLSARVLTEDILKGFSIGADDYMRKPFNLEELIARINRLLKNKTLPKNIKSEVNIGAYIYNPDTYQLNFKGNESTLSPRLGEILHRLITSEDRILHRQKTLIDLWGDDNFFNGRSLDVFIYKLRKHLSEDPNIKIINIRGVGYRLVLN